MKIRIDRLCKLTLMVSAMLCSTALMAQEVSPTPRIVDPIDHDQLVVLKGNVPRVTQHAENLGPLDPVTVLPRVTLLIQLTDAQRAALQELLGEQKASLSPNFHKWLTPNQFGERFGLGDADAAKITSWLQSQGFTGIEISPGRNRISFSGTVAQIEGTFQTQIERFTVNGEERFSIATEPSIPQAFQGVVAGITGLDNFRAGQHR
jgi:subtilase family serine protease